METHPPHAIEKVGFPAIRDRIVEACHSVPGAERAHRLGPLRDADEARRRLAHVSALQDVLRFGDPMPEPAFEPVADALRRATPAGAFLEPEELSTIRVLAACARRMRAYLAASGAARASGSAPAFGASGASATSGAAAASGAAPASGASATTGAGPGLSPLAELAATLEPVPAVERVLDALLDADGKVREDASPELRRLRREAARARDRLRGELSNALGRAVAEGWAADEQPTLRGGRMVIPLHAESRRRMEGLVHDVSATGQTVYFEPSACVELNNGLRAIEAAERREIVRLLAAATDTIRAHRPALETDEDSLATIDVLVSSARLANRLGATVPEAGEGAVIELRGARNPELLLRVDRPDDVVPLTLRLDGGMRMIVISGPNAGGKSVALKTLGACACMLAAGLPIPCDAGSRFDWFDRLIVELGDDQSVADDLSTFSSHLGHLRDAIEGADARSLVLIDEAGSGTDPDEGSAVAQAVLEALLRRGARCVVTTHHGPLKRFAHDTDGVSNGMMSFDRATLRPTFRFVPGVPGASYAFEIAERLGLGSEVVERAKSLAGSDRAGLERLLADLDARNHALRTEVDRAAREAAEAQKHRATLEHRLEELKQVRADIRVRALEEADRVLAEANAAVERAVREIRESRAQPETVRAARASLESAKETVRRRRRREIRRGARRGPGTMGDISVGDQVTVDGAGQPGEVLELRASEAVVAMGSARLRVERSRLVRVGGRRRQEVTVRQVSDTPSGWVAARARTRVDLRGTRVDEALAEVVRLVDEAVAAGLGRVEILHGKGTGALRAAIHEYLSSRPEVTSYDEAPIEQGGAGVTVVSL